MALMRHALESGAQLLSGGNGHPRWREWLLGGTTRALPDAMRLPTLPSHRARFAISTRMDFLAHALARVRTRSGLARMPVRGFGQAGVDSIGDGRGKTDRVAGVGHAVGADDFPRTGIAQ